jgi:hypothetical protein
MESSLKLQQPTVVPSQERDLTGHRRPTPSSQDALDRMRLTIARAKEGDPRRGAIRLPVLRRQHLRHGRPRGRRRHTACVRQVDDHDQPLRRSWSAVLCLAALGSPATSQSTTLGRLTPIESVIDPDAGPGPDMDRAQLGARRLVIADQARSCRPVPFVPCHPRGDQGDGWLRRQLFLVVARGRG